jgi:preprotein translocase subunit SecG
METALLGLHIVAAIGIVGLVLLQHGKGADVGAAFGTGSAGSVFGASGSANFLSRATAVLALLFFATSLGLTYFSTRKTDTGGVMVNQPAPVQSLPGQIPGQAPAQTAPAQPAAEGQASPATTTSPAAPATTGGGKAQDIPN